MNKELSQPWWILIPKIKTNKNKQQYNLCNITISYR